MSEGATILLLGCGNMGQALLRGWIAAGRLPASICVIEPAGPDGPLRAGALASRVFKTVEAATAAGITPPDVILLAVKPQMMDQALPQLLPLLTPKCLAISIAAGVTLAHIAAGLSGPDGPHQRIIRAMPNTPAAIGQGSTALVATSAVDAAGRALASDLLAASGAVHWLDNEALIDAVTAVSGSGPAYVFHLIECLAQAGVNAGLDPALAQKLALETVAGSGALAMQSGETPEQLRINVTSPNGTTAAGLAVLMDGTSGLQRLMDRTVSAAHRRAQELGKR